MSNKERFEMNDKKERIVFEVSDAGNEITLLKMSGDLDMYTLPMAKERMNQLIDEKKCRIIIDLENVAYVDSSGLGFFIGSLKKLRENNGDLKLINLNNYIHGIFKLIHLHTIISIFDNLDDALKDF
jgi:anti-sigma B factor antagonist